MAVTFSLLLAASDSSCLSAETVWLAVQDDVWEAEAPRDRFAGDGVHPSPKGTAFVVGRWYGLLSKDSTAQPWLKKD